MTGRSERDEAILASIVSGDLDPTEEPARSLLASSPGLLERVESLRTTARGIDEAAKYRDRVLHDAEQIESPPGGSDVARWVEDHAVADVGATQPVAAPTGAAPPSGRNGAPATSVSVPEIGPTATRRWALAAVAAVVLIAGTLAVRSALDRGDGGSPPEELRLGSGDITIAIEAPSGSVTEAEQFRWSSSNSLPSGGYFEVRIYEGEVARVDRLRVTSEQIRDTTWSPTTEELDSCRGTFCWEVRAYGTANQRIAVSDPTVVVVSGESDSP